MRKLFPIILLLLIIISGCIEEKKEAKLISISMEIDKYSIWADKKDTINFEFSGIYNDGTIKELEPTTVIIVNLDTNSSINISETYYTSDNPGEYTVYGKYEGLKSEKQKFTVKELPKADKIEVSINKNEIFADNTENVEINILKVIDQYGNELNINDLSPSYFVIDNLNNKKILESNIFTTDSDGLYKLLVEIDGIESNKEFITVKELSRADKIEISINKYSIFANNSDSIEINLLKVVDQYGNELNINDLNPNYYYIDNLNNKILLEGKSFKSETSGNYRLLVDIDGYESNKINIEIKELPKISKLSILNTNNKTSINGDGIEKIIFSSRAIDQYGSDIELENVKYIYSFNSELYELEGNSFTSNTPGNYYFKSKSNENVSENEIMITVIPYNNDEKNVSETKTWLTFDIIANGNLNEDNITGLLSLPKNDPNGYGIQIIWSRFGSKNGADINPENGSVTRGTEDTTIQLTATILKDSLSDSKVFRLIVKQSDGIQDQKDVKTEIEKLNFEYIRGNNTDENEITYPLIIPKIMNNGVKVKWSVTGEINGAKIDLETGIITRGTKDAKINLISNLSKGIYEESIDFLLTIKQSIQSIQDDIDLAKQDLNFTKIKIDNISESEVNSKLNLIKEGVNNTEIKWELSGNINNTNIDLNTGEVTRGTEDTNVKLTAIISKYTEKSSKEFIFKILESEISKDIKSVNKAKEALEFTNIKGNNFVENEIKENLNLIKQGLEGTVITWKVDGLQNEANIDINTGQVDRGNYDTPVVLVAEIKKGEAIDTKQFNLVIKETEYSYNFRSVALTKQDLSFEKIAKANTSPNNILGDLYLPKQGINQTEIIWSKSGGTIEIDIDLESGKVKRASEDIEIILTAIIKKEEIEDKTGFVLTVKAINFEEDVNLAYNNLTFNSIKNKNENENKIYSDLNLPTLWTGNTSIKWSVSGLNSGAILNVNDGTIIRGTRDVEITLNAIITKGEINKSKDFILTIKQSESSIYSEISKVKEWLTFDVIKGDNSKPHEITSRIILPERGENDILINWDKIIDTSKADIDLSSGNIIRGTEDVYLTLNAKLTKEGIEDTKIFNFLILGKDDEKDVNIAFDSLTFDVIKGNNESSANITEDFILTKEGINDVNINWSKSSLENSADINLETGEITRGTKDTNLILTAKLSKGEFTKIKEFFVLIKKAVIESIKLNKRELLFTEVNSTYQLSVDIEPFDIVNKKVLWISSNPDVAIVSNNGMITALKSGESEIKVLSLIENTRFDICKVQVNIPIESIKITNDNIILNKWSQEYQLDWIIEPEFTSKDIIFESSDSSILTVNELGIIQALSSGKVKVTVSSKIDENIFDSKIVTIDIPNIQEINPLPKYLHLGINERKKVEIEVIPSNSNRNIYLLSKNSNIVSIDENGYLLGVSSGNTKVNAISIENSQIYSEIVVNVGTTKSSFSIGSEYNDDLSYIRKVDNFYEIFNSYHDGEIRTYETLKFDNSKLINKTLLEFEDISFSKYIRNMDNGISLIYSKPSENYENNYYGVLKDGVLEEKTKYSEYFSDIENFNNNFVIVKYYKGSGSERNYYLSLNNSNFVQVWSFGLKSTYADILDVKDNKITLLRKTISYSTSPYQLINYDFEGNYLGNSSYISENGIRAYQFVDNYIYFSNKSNDRFEVYKYDNETLQKESEYIFDGNESTDLKFINYNENNVLLSGTTKVSNFSDIEALGSQDIYLLLLDKDLNFVKHKIIGSYVGDDIYKIHKTKDNCFIMFCIIDGKTSIIKINLNLDILWRNDYKCWINFSFVEELEDGTFTIIAKGKDLDFVENKGNIDIYYLRMNRSGEFF